MRGRHHQQVKGSSVKEIQRWGFRALWICLDRGHSRILMLGLLHCSLPNALEYTGR